jgi:hypothetical protein
MAMTATNFTVADSSDPYSLDVVGFDSNVPNSVILDEWLNTFFREHAYNAHDECKAKRIKMTKKVQSQKLKECNKLAHKELMRLLKKLMPAYKETTAITITFSDGFSYQGLISKMPFEYLEWFIKGLLDEDDVSQAA